MAVPRGARFRELAGALDTECRALGMPLRPGAAEELLADRVSDLAVAMQISESWALRGYFGDDWASQMAQGMATQMHSDAAMSAARPPVQVPLIVAGQLVAALGQAALFAAVNAEYADPDECTRVGIGSGQAVTAFGLALTAPHRLAEDLWVVEVAAETVTHTEQTLVTFAERLVAGEWRSCWCGLDDAGHPDHELLAEQVLGGLESVRSVLAAQ